MSYINNDLYTPETTQKLAEHYNEILKLLGEDPEREGLEKTPLRVAKAMQFLTKGYQEDPAAILNSARFREEYQQMVLVKDIEMYSMCEHHMLPFYGKAHVAIFPTGSSQASANGPCGGYLCQRFERLTVQIGIVFNKHHPMGSGGGDRGRHVYADKRRAETTFKGW